MRSSFRRRTSLVRLSLLAVLTGACAPDEATAPGASLEPPGVVRPVQGRFRTEGYPTRGELRTGWVLGRDGRPMRVTYEVHNGKAIWQGDIVLGRASEISTTAEGAKPYMRVARDVSLRVGQTILPGVAIDDGGARWPGGVMPYEIDGAVMNPGRVAQAIALIENTTGGVTIVPRNGHSDYIKFIDSDACSSDIGRKGGMQEIELAVDCSVGSTAHEMLHALGMDHEQSRCDRDTYVEIQFDHIADEDRHNFDKVCDGYTDHATYDFGSIMHYSLKAFSTDDQPTIKLRDGITYNGTIGQRSALGITDRITINFLYGLNNITPVAKICDFTGPYTEGTEVQVDGTCSTDADDAENALTYDWNWGDGTCAGPVESAECTDAKPKHTYVDDGKYKVGLTVFDSYAIDATEQFITIDNVPPAFTFGPFAAIDEGSLFRRFMNYTDPGQDFWSGSVNYGDGGGPLSLDVTGKNFTLDHLYADNSPPGSPFQLSVSITDDDETTTKTANITVRNVNPLVNAGPDQVIESGKSLDFLGSFSDAGDFDAPWGWSIAWGVGSPTTGSTNTQGNITASRQFCAAGTYTVTLSVTDKDNGTGSDGLQVTVGHVIIPLDITPGGTPNALNPKKQGSLSVAIVSTPTFDARTVDIASVRLGDEAGNDTPAEMQKGKYVTRLDDVNKDGLIDMVVSFSVPALLANGDLTSSTTSLVLRGSQGAAGGSCVNFRGTDAIVIVSQ